MKQHIFIIGLFDKDTKKQELEKVEAVKRIAKICGDCTMTDAWGHYTHDDGTTVLEPSIKVEMLFKEDSQIAGFCEELKRELNQESIYYDYKEVNAKLM